MSQVDRRTGLVGNTGIKEPVRVATTANITLSGEQTIDGVAVVDGDRVLVKDQTTAANNGIYECDTGTWSRTKDMDGSYDVVNGTLVYVRSGTTNGDVVFKCTATNPITIGTTSLSWASVDLAWISNFISSLTAETSPATDDVVPMYDTSAAANRKITIANMLKVLTLLTAETAPAVDDELFLYDLSATVTDKITLANLLKVVNALTAETAPATDDELLLYDLSATTADKITLANMLKVLNVLTEDTTPDTAADYALSYDTSAAAVKKVLLNKIGRPVSGTAQATTSGSAWDFTIPAGVKHALVLFYANSLSGTDSHLVQLGTSGGIVSTGYTSNSSFDGGIVTSTAGFIVQNQAAANALSGHMLLSLADTGKWVSSHASRTSATISQWGGGSVDLGAELTTIRLTRTGTDTGDAGTVNVLYW